MKLNPGFLKLDLFCRGIRIDASCRLNDDARSVSRTRGGLGSGLEIILPDGLYANVPIEEHFVAKSPYVLYKKKDTYFIEKENVKLCTVKIPPRPRFYAQKTKAGKPMSRIGMMQGTYLGIYPTNICEFWQMDPRMNCRFCSIGLNVGSTEETEKTVEDVMETVTAAQQEEHITFVHFNTGFLWGDELKILGPYIKAVKKRKLMVGVQCPPVAEREYYKNLKKLGVDHLSFCVEVFDKEKFKEICPGKHRYLTQETYLDTIEYCSKMFGKGRVAGEIIAGLEPVSSTIAAIEYFAKRGVVSTVCVFRPCLGTDFAHLDPPQPDELIPVFRRMYEVCMENKIPIGIAPRIKVSLVLLPEEGRYFVDKDFRRFVFVKLQFTVLKILYRFYLKLRKIFL
ncbi:MAG: radical SAM protein [Candidatus Omnitrophica bacterium]|nr:radical SAM protein [Candidatus Omnitrophota bacterium]